MKCDACGDITWVNWGDAGVVICKGCYGKDSARELLASRGPAESQPKVHSDHQPQQSRRRPVAWLLITIGVVLIVSAVAGALRGQAEYSDLLASLSGRTAFDHQLVRTAARLNRYNLIGQFIQGVVGLLLVGAGRRRLSPSESVTPGSCDQA